MDALTHKTGITPQGRLIHGDQPEPTLAERHANRLRRACATMAPPSPHLVVRTVDHADGRTAYPEVVQYQVQRWSAADRAHMPVLIDLPPTDPAETYRIVVHDLPAYGRLPAGRRAGVRAPAAAGGRLTMLPPGGWRIVPEGEHAVLLDPRGAEVLRHWYVPFVRRVQRRLSSRKGLNAELVRGICRDEACFRFEFSDAYQDDFDRAANAAE